MKMRGSRFLSKGTNKISIPRYLTNYKFQPKCKLNVHYTMYFQHDGAPSHYTRHVTQHLNDTFPNTWIGRGSTIHWPPRSPDLTPLEFCLRGLMKSEACRKKVDTRDELLVNILDVIACIKDHQNALRRTTRHVFTRVAKCIDVDGGIFEHLLYPFTNSVI